MRRRKTHEEYVAELVIKNPTVEVVEKYIDAKTKIMHHCLIHDVYWLISPHNALRGKGCNQCMRERVGNRLRKSHVQYVDELSIKNPNLEVIETYINHFTPILHHCLIHDIYWKISPANALKGQGCIGCRKDKHRKSMAKTQEQYISEVAMINTNIEVLGMYLNAFTPILHKCKIHDTQWMMRPDNVLHGECGCPQCTESIGERTVRQWFDMHDVKYDFQYIFSDCCDKQPLPFDFYLPDYNAAIEFQGKQHYEPVEIFGGQEALEYTQRHDKIKSDYCKQNSIRLLCIKYDEDINEKLTNFLFI